MRTINIQTIKSARAQRALPQAATIESATFSVVGAGVVVDPLITLALAPGTLRERTAVGIVAGLAQPTPFLAPGIKPASYSAGHQSVDVVLTVSVDAGASVAQARPSEIVSLVSRHEPHIDAMGVMPHAVPAPDADLCFPSVEPAEANETTRRRIWAEVCARI